MRSPCALIALSLLCLLATAWPAGRSSAADSQQVFAHLFTVPDALPDGADPAPRIVALKAWLSETFGGYTRLGPGEGGWKNETGAVETETNTVYLVTAPRDVSRDIGAWLAREFGVRVPYVLVLPAALFVK